jgi:hypothetical protein
MGERVTGANPKDRLGIAKPQLHLVPAAALIREARVFEHGADKAHPPRRKCYREGGEEARSARQPLPSPSVAGDRRMRARIGRREKVFGPGRAAGGLGEDTYVTSNRYVIGVPDRAVVPGQRAPWPPRRSTGQIGRVQEKEERKTALDAMLRTAAALPDLLAMRRAVIEGRTRQNRRDCAYS